DAGPVLVDAVIAAGGEEFFGSHEAQGIEVVRRHHVRAAFAAVEREQRDARALTARFVGEHAAVLVVGVRGEHDQTGPGMKFFETLPKSGRTAIYTDFLGDGRGFDCNAVGQLGDGAGCRRKGKKKLHLYSMLLNITGCFGEEGPGIGFVWQNALMRKFASPRLTHGFAALTGIGKFASLGVVEAALAAKVSVSGIGFVL